MTLARPALALAVLLLTVTLTTAEEPDREAQRLRGIWAAHSVTIDGVKAPDDPTMGTTMLAFDGSSYVQREGGRITEEGDYRVSGEKDPKAIDLVIEKGPNSGQRQLGVYQLSGDSLRVCLSRPGAKSRPKDFNSKPGTGQSVVELRRYRP